MGALAFAAEEQVGPRNAIQGHLIEHDCLIFGDYLKFSCPLCFITRFLTVVPVIGNSGLELTVPGVDGVVSYSTAMRLNLRLRRVFGLQIQNRK